MRRSLRARLAVLGAVAILAALLGAGFAIDRLLTRAVERGFRQQMDTALLALMARVEVEDASGRVTLEAPPAEPRFEQPLSGWYWQVTSGAEILLRSRSLFDQEILGEQGPAGEALLTLRQDFTSPGSPELLTATVAVPLAEIAAARGELVRPLVLSLAALGLALLLASLVQIGVGLAPLGRLRRDLDAVRRGQRARMPEAPHAEVAPLVASMNALLTHKEAMLDRARRHAGDLAHALQTPLAALRNAAEGDAQVTALVARMEAQIRRHLSRARTAATAGLPGARCAVAPVLEDLALVLRAAHRDRAVTLEIAAEGAPDFAGDRGDLEEMAGNLMDNACKWARGRVQVSARAEAGRLLIRIADDGPGMAPEARAAALARGRRLDEAVPGHGLGLAIVAETADLYGGALELEGEGPGLVALLRLPLAP
ncbi:MULTISPECIES: sensor histidine kinase [Roseomonadaceae]|uniref:histidine kinase n=1 Tax=Falsiroseomonas oleicola TaxID=2801474 RepID=A0ABS6HDB7_9PROT|nr:HAMP domain-containing sensor histidine kinase [Roseomonas oleicola]MBU8545663.1 HAMP domain-containing histidine kinase [Roseomonas oleicola]